MIESNCDLCLLYSTCNFFEGGNIPKHGNYYKCKNLKNISFKIQSHPNYSIIVVIQDSFIPCTLIFIHVCHWFSIIMKNNIFFAFLCLFYILFSFFKNFVVELRDTAYDFFFESFDSKSFWFWLFSTNDLSIAIGMFRWFSIYVFVFFLWCFDVLFDYELIYYIVLLLFSFCD